MSYVRHDSLMYQIPVHFGPCVTPRQNKEGKRFIYDQATRLTKHTIVYESDPEALSAVLPQRFELEYVGADGEKHRPIMIHRVVFGSIERFIGILIEHFAGAFPTWLAPVQVKVLPISDKYADYGKKVLDALHEAGIRAEMDTRSEKIGYKIREAQGQKIPYMLIAGAKEEEAGLVSVRSRFAGDEGQRSLEQFIADIKEEIASRVNRPVTVETKENK